MSQYLETFYLTKLLLIWFPQVIKRTTVLYAFPIIDGKILLLLLYF